MEWGFVGRQAEMRDVGDVVAERSSILLAGPAGVGKSRLAEEVMSTLARSHYLERLTGTPSIRELPFGGVAHLVGDAPLPDVAVLITFLARSLVRRADGKPIAVLIDDIDQLDDGSIGLVQHVLTEGLAVVLATARDEGASDPRILPLWKDGLLNRFDVAPLSRDETEQLTTRIVGQACTSDLHNQIWHLTEGHPLFIREILLEAVDQGATTDQGGLVGLTHHLGSSRRVADIVRQRTAHLDDQELEALRMVALCQPVSLSLLQRLASEAPLASLETKKMIKVEPSDTGPRVRTNHPLVAEVTIGQMPGITSAAMTARLARVLISDPAMSPRDAMRASLWLLDAGEPLPHGVATAGARSALSSFDPALAKRLSEAALLAGGGQEARVLLGQALTAAGEAAAAVETLRLAQEEATSDPELAAATTALAQLYTFNVGEASTAVAILEQSIGKVTEPGSRAQMISHLMIAAGLIGDFELGLRVGSDVVDRTDLPEPAQVMITMAMTLSQTMTGKLESILDRLDRGLVLAARYADIQPLAPDQMGLNRVLALHALARLDDAGVFGRDAVRRGVGLPGPWLFNLAMVHTLTGDVIEAEHLARQARDQLQMFDPLGLAPMADAIHSLFSAMNGKSQQAIDLLARARSDPRGRLPRTAVWANRAQAWIAAQDGSASKAADLAVQTGRDTIAATHHVWGAMATHDAVRFGYPERAVDDLQALKAEERGELVSLLADHAAALMSGAESTLRTVANRCVEAGANAMAAECWAKLASVTSGTEQARHSLVALKLLQDCPGFKSAWTEGLEAPLSNRQEEVARLAAQGSTSKEIATLLHLSARTVDNHLRKVYLTLGLDGRSELADLYAM